MSRASHYRAQADLARRLAELTVQPDLEWELRYVAEELDHLANEIAGRYRFPSRGGAGTTRLVAR